MNRIFFERKDSYLLSKMELKGTVEREKCLRLKFCITMYKASNDIVYIRFVHKISIAL